MPIDTDRWNRLKAIFNEIAELPTAERSSAIERHCGTDDALRREVESLLQADERASRFIEQPAVAAAGLDAIPSSLPETIGPYRVIREVSRGGMGTVYLGEREGDYQRQVAIKLIRRGMDSDPIVARFRNERQILASLDHPNIAHLLDGGTTASGQPYFVMEYIEGTPIDRYCEERNLGVDERLRLFQSVCSAVQYAHRNLIVHRDLKPANILVTGDGVPKLLDFGIAKVLGGTDEGLQTATEQRILTPEYASPEQITGERVTTATDVYSLGVVLYELLTGTRPYRLRQRSAAGLAEALSSSEPARPSTAVREAPDSATSQARERRLRGDLDNIVLLAMRKDPARRYASAQALADDIARHLEGKPVAARPDTWSYRAGKFARRNRGAVIAASIAIVALLAGTAAATWQAVEARRAQARAERRFGQLRKLARAMIFEIEPEISQITGTTHAREKIVSNALLYLDSLAAESADDPGLQLELASAYRQVAEVQGNSYGSNLGKVVESVRSYEKALRIAQSAVNARPGSAPALESLAQVQEGLADVLYQQGELERTNQTYLAALKSRERLARVRKPTVADQRAVALVISKRADVLGNSGLGNLGHTEESLAEHKRALALREALMAANPGHPRIPRDVAESLTKIAYAQNGRGDYAAAAATNERAVEIAKRIAAMNPDSGNDQQDYSLACMLTSFPLRELGRHDEAIRWVEQSYEIMQQLAQKDPASTLWQRNLSVILNHMSALNADRGDFARAAEASEKSIEIAERLWQADTSNLEGSLDLAISMRRYHEALNGAHRWTDVARLSPRAIEIAAALEAKGNARATFERALLDMQFARALAHTGRHAEALRHAGLAIDTLAAQAKESPDDIETRDQLARAHLARAEVLFDSDRTRACTDLAAASGHFHAMSASGKLRFRSRSTMAAADALSSRCGS